MSRVACAALIAALAPLRTRGQPPSPFDARCATATDTCSVWDPSLSAYSTYSVPDAVKRNEPDYQFPTDEDEDEVRKYVETVIAPAVFLVLLACCCFFTLCFWNCCLCKRLHRDGKCVPSETWALRDRCWHRCAWVFLAVLAVLFVGMGIGATISTAELETEIQDLPTTLGNYAKFLDTEIAPVFNCTGNIGQDIADSSDVMLADDVLNSTYCNTTYVSVVDRGVCEFNRTKWTELLEDIKNASLDFKKTMSDVHETLTDGANELRDAEEDAEDYVAQTEAGFGTPVVVFSLFVLLCGFCTVMLTARAAKHEVHDNEKRFRQHTGLLCVGLETLVFIMWFLFLLCGIAIIYLRGTAGFCVAPFKVMEKTLGGNASDTGVYYALCSTYTYGELVTYWPWESERIEAAQEFNRLDTNVTELEVLWQGNSTNLDHMVNLTRNLGCQVSTSAAVISDRGILSPTSIMSCQMGDRFVQDVVIRLCEETFTPIEQLVAFLFLLAVTTVCCICNQQWLRREVNYSDVPMSAVDMWDDHGAGSPPAYAGYGEKNAEGEYIEMEGQSSQV